MNALIRFFLQRHLLVNMIVIAVLGIGLFVVGRTQREGFPATSLNYCVINAVLAGASADDVEKKLTIPIERALAGVDGIRQITSTSSENLSFVTVEIFDGYSEAEVKETVDEIRREVAAAPGLPPDLDPAPRVHLLDPARLPALEIFLAGDKAQVVPLGRRLKDTLEREEGVSEVVELGFSDPELHVLLDADRAQGLGITFDEVFVALSSQNRTETGGKLHSFPEEKQVVLVTRFETVADVERAVVRVSPDGGRITVADVARVVPAYDDRNLIVHGNGQSGVSLVVRKRASADIMRTVDRLYAVLDHLDLPDGVAVYTFNDGSQLARERLELVGQNGLGGIVLVLIVLVIFLSRRIAFWVAFGIPFAVFGVLALLPLVGITVNVVSMAGFVLVIGLIVDDAIVVAERIAHHREQGLSPNEAGARGAHDMALPVIASSLTTIMAFSPMFAIGGLPGRFAWAIPTIVILALSVSLFECFFLLPAHVSSDEGKAARVQDEKPPWLLRLEGAYMRSLSFVLRHRRLFVGSFVVLFVASMVFAKLFMSFVMFPQEGARSVHVKIFMPVGTPLLRTEAAVRFVEAQIPDLVGTDLEGTTARVGHKNLQHSSNLGREANEAIVNVFLTRDRDHTAAEWIETLKAKLQPPASAHLVFEAQRIGPPLGRPVTVHIESDDQRRRRTATKRVMDYLNGLPFVTDLEVDERTGLTQIDLRPDLDKLAQRGVDLDQVVRALKGAFVGVPVTEIRTGSDVEKVRLRFSEAARRDLEGLLDMPVRSRAGFLVPLRDLVSPAERHSVARIERMDEVRTTTVTAAIDDRSGQTSRSVATLLQTQLFTDPALNGPGLHVRIGGEAQKSAETLGELPFVAAMALVGMLMIVTLLFGSVLQALFIVIAVPLGYVGVIWTFAAHGMPLSFFALLGAIGLSGVVVNDSIVMVSTLSGSGQTEVNDIVRSAAERLRPVILTSLTTVVGVMPTAYGFGGRDALLSPMSLSLGWGLLFATVITLYLVPSLYAVRKDFEGWRARRSESAE